MSTAPSRAETAELALATSLHRALLIARALEQTCIERLGHWYASIGEEAAVVGTFASLDEGDVAAPHYRGGLAAFWLRGLPLVEVIGALLAKEGSTTNGRLSGLHSGPIDRGVIPYATNVLGPNLSTAAGMALGFTVQKSDRVVVAAFGDGTSGLGQFHECLNLSAVLNLPIVWMCQNNQYSISSRADATHGGSGLSSWAERYGMPAETVDGNDVVAVHEAVGRCIARARTGAGPAFVEAMTYRMTGHFSSDPATYRNEDEFQHWSGRDPIALSANRLTEWGVGASELTDMRTAAQAEVEEAWQTAAARPDVAADRLGLDEAMAPLWAGSR